MHTSERPFSIDRETDGGTVTVCLGDCRRLGTVLHRVTTLRHATTLPIPFIFIYLDMSLTSSKKWRESDTIKFVELYESAECLWNFRHPSYKNRHSRDRAIQYIIEQMNLPDFGVNELKNKIKNIRSTYQQEVNKIKRWRAAPGADFVEEYKTNLAWFPIADRFLKTCINSTKNALNTQVEEDFNSSYLNNQPALYNLVETEMTGGIDQQLDLKLSPSYLTIEHIKEEPMRDEYNGPAVKKRRTSQPHFMENAEQGPDEPELNLTSDNTIQDEWHYFGHNVACQLRNMPLERALTTQKRLMEILIEERIESLKTEREVQTKSEELDE